MAESATPRWKFLTNHAQVLVCIAHDPGVWLREISERVGITERAAHRIVAELADARLHHARARGPAQQVHDPDGPAAARPPRRRKNVGDLLAVLVSES